MDTVFVFISSTGPASRQNPSENIFPKEPIKWNTVHYFISIDHFSIKSIRASKKDYFHGFQEKEKFLRKHFFRKLLGPPRWKCLLFHQH
ncbi:hypothetical protein Y032_0529g2996 [Ancylostoma ceylanicum]|uniref:Uncharacterized protein n=1 Tax=Ancylostoma ceylanicum TaxID=53326 RepID=A0A016WTD4_9BILA|nr:hypothetical protein Y032_0529g2996 [Ancylostoma ceylanicum]